MLSKQLKTALLGKEWQVYTALSVFQGHIFPILPCATHSEQKILYLCHITTLSSYMKWHVGLDDFKNLSYL